jgi:hypothetical protein
MAIESIVTIQFIYDLFIVVVRALKVKEKVMGLKSNMIIEQIGYKLWTLVCCLI